MLHIGTSGWWYADWQGIVYPARGRHDPLESLARLFNALEINVSFYRDLEPRMAESWLRRVSSHPDFRFTAKLHQRFTHGRVQPFPTNDLRQSLRGLEPLHGACRLGALLAQFPWSVRDGVDQRDWLQRLNEATQGFPLVVELRHDSWLTDDSLAFLKSLGVAFCNIDQPAHQHCIPPTELVMAPIAYVRLHGRNHARWWDHDQPHQRYDYLYTEPEIDGWVGRIRRIAQQATQTFVFTNNHFRGQAAANALQIKAKSTGELVDVPPGLLAEFPELYKIARPDPTPHQRELF